MADWPGLGARRAPDGVRRAWDRGAVATPGGCRRGRARRPSRRARHRHGVRQVARLPAAHPRKHPEEPRRTRGTRIHRALPGSHEGARARPDGRPPRARHGRAGVHPRRRQPVGAARLDPRPRRVRPDQPRHAAPLAAARAQPVGRLPRIARLCRGRRVPPLPRGLRRPRVPCVAAAAASLRAVRRTPDVRARVGHDGRSGGHRRTPDWSGRLARHRRRFAPRPGRPGPVGAAVHVVDRRERRAGPPGRVVGDGRPPDRPRGRGGADAGVRAVASRCGAGRDDDGRAPRRRRPVPPVLGWRRTAAATCPRNAATSRRRCAPAS